MLLSFAFPKYYSNLCCALNIINDSFGFNVIHKAEYYNKKIMGLLLLKELCKEILL